MTDTKTSALVSRMPNLQAIVAAGVGQIENACEQAGVSWTEVALCLDYAIEEDSNLATVAKANPASVVRAVVHCAMHGLRPGPLHHHFALIPRTPRKGKAYCDFLVEYRGLIDIARRAGELKDVRAELVYSGEVFDYDRGAGTIHHPYEMGIDRNPAKILAAYAIATVEGWARDIPYVMTVEEIRREAMSKSPAATRPKEKGGPSGPWIDDFGPMCKKTVLRRLFGSGMIPMNTSAARRIQRDNTGDVPVEEVHNVTDETDVRDEPAPEPASQVKDWNKELTAAVKRMKNAEHVDHLLGLIDKHAEEGNLSAPQRLSLMQAVHTRAATLRDEADKVARR